MNSNQFFSDYEHLLDFKILANYFPPISEASHVCINYINKFYVGVNNYMIEIELIFINDGNDQQEFKYHATTDNIDIIDDWDEDRTEAVAVVLRKNDKFYNHCEKYCSKPIDDSCSLEQESEDYNPNY